MRVFHLSHTDLDGYGCQFVTSNIFDNIEFLNANYGEEVLKKADFILNNLDKDRKNFILITDLNLTLEESKYLDKKVKELKENGFDVELQLLDHHGTGIDSAESFEWYFLDVTRSASKITYDYFKEKYDLKNIEKLIDAINAVDIWLQNEELFEFGKVLMRAVDEAKEINRVMFAKENVLYKHHMLQNSIKYLENNSYIDLDDNLYLIKKSFFEYEKRDTLDNMVTNFLISLLNKKRDEITIYYQDKKGILTFGIQNSSIVGNGFLNANPDFHFFMNVNPRGTFSLRANNLMDVSKMAKEIAGGGGHPNASGGKIKEFKEQFNYSELKSYIQNYLEEKS